MAQGGRCLECGEDLEPGFTACWRCGTQQPFSWIGDGIKKAAGQEAPRARDAKEDNTLLIEGQETIHFNDWPAFWRRPDDPDATG